MQGYRLYFLGRAGRIERALELSCEDDVDAIREAGNHKARQAMELWQGGRMVMAFPATPLNLSS